MNRIQNLSITSECREQETTWTCVNVFSQEQQDGWIEIMAPPVYNSDSDMFIQILPSLQDDGLTYPHIGLVDISAGDTQSDTSFLTRGSFVVTEIVAWDLDTDIIYFMGTEEGRPGVSHLYTVSADGSSEHVCITCTLVTSRGESCLRNSVDMNWDNTYYIHTCRGPVSIK